MQLVADAISYQPFGGVNSLTYGNGLTETRTYDLDGRLTDISLDGADGRHYSYDGVGNITAIDHGATTHTYGYDAVDRLTSAETGDALIDQYRYDLLGNHTAHTDDSHTEALTYAAGSNRLADRDGTADGRYTYQYTPENRLWGSSTAARWWQPTPTTSRACVSGHWKLTQLGQNLCPTSG